MKTIILNLTLTVSLFLPQFSNFAYSQSQHLGIWEGVFMDDFKTKIEFTRDTNNRNEGKIEMFSGSNKIQDDPISKITINGNLITFHIESKNTDFKGEFNGENSELTGVFIFPDNSEHPLKLSKQKNNEFSAENSKESFHDLRNKKFPVDELKEDLSFLVGKLKELHPNLDTNFSKAKLDSLAQIIANNINAELSIIEFFNKIAPLVESIKCSHTGIRLPVDFQTSIFKNDNFLPLKILFEENNAFCLKNFDATNEQLVPGMEIVSINGIPIWKIKENVQHFIPSEKENTTTKNYVLNQQFNTFYNWLDNSESFEIEYYNSGERGKTKVKACRFSALDENFEDSKEEKPVDFYIDNKKDVGFLTVRSFIADDINHYIKKMDSIFLSLQSKNTGNLVLDLRGNSGGHPIFAAQLFSYLTNSEFTYFKRNSEVNEFEPLYNKMKPDRIRFKGNIYVFVDGGCLSTAGHLISLLKNYTQAKFVGEEPGSTYCCNDFSLKVSLPKTGIEANIPRTSFETAIPEEAKTDFIVDHRINISKNDYLNGVDKYVQHINTLITEP